jgi:chromosome partitioning protein
VVVAHVKGGVGKSTTATQLALHFAARGLAVLLVDADPGRTALSWRYRAGDAWPKAVTVVPQLSAADLAGRVRAAGAGHGMVIVDTPHSPTEGTDVGPVVAAALGIADLVVVPTSPSAADIDRLGDLVGAISREQARRPELAWTLLLNRVDLRSRTMLQAMRDGIRQRGLPLLEAVVPMRAGVAQAFGTAERRVEYASVADQVLVAVAEQAMR